MLNFLAWFFKLKTKFSFRKKSSDLKLEFKYNEFSALISSNVRESTYQA